MSTLGKGIDFGAMHFSPESLTLSILDRYKNRMAISPTAQCLGLDMNRYVPIFRTFTHIET